MHVFVGGTAKVIHCKTSKEKEVKCDSDASLWMLCLNQLTFLEGNFQQMIKSTRFVFSVSMLNALTRRRGVYLEKVEDLKAQFGEMWS